ncbi:hypothetical protein BKA70DRAFT_1243653 [Coprinopsis sp. MPI-PUGE-AT-0042]|nr:hypothetical protein BKA70DRAFT_1243653 [Coprinopsis sp. MPI-PUGE-AT-0042]
MLTALDDIQSTSLLYQPSHGEGSSSLRLAGMATFSTIRKFAWQIGMLTRLFIIPLSTTTHYPPLHSRSHWTTPLSSFSGSAYYGTNLAITEHPPVAQRVATLHLPEPLGPAHSTRPSNPPPTQFLAAGYSVRGSNEAHGTRPSETAHKVFSKDAHGEGMQVETGRCETMWWDGLDLEGQH